MESENSLAQAVYTPEENRRLEDIRSLSTRQLEGALQNVFNGNRVMFPVRERVQMVTLNSPLQSQNELYRTVEMTREEIERELQIRNGQAIPREHNISLPNGEEIIFDEAAADSSDIWDRVVTTGVPVYKYRLSEWDRYVAQIQGSFDKLDSKEPWEEYASVLSTGPVFNNRGHKLEIKMGPEPYDDASWVKELRELAKKLGLKRKAEVEARKEMEKQFKKEMAEKEKAYTKALEESVDEVLSRAVEASA